MDQIGFAVPLMRRRDKRVWLAKRRHVLGATDAVAVLGFSKWATPLDVWLAKTGRYADDTIGDKYVVQRGNLLESLIVTEWSRRNDAALIDFPPLLGHPDHPWLAASLDAVGTIDGYQTPCEAKAVTWRAREDWWDESMLVPDQYAAQVLVQLAVTGLDVAHICADVAGEFRQVQIERDRDFEAWALPALADWWQAHVVADVPPDPDPVRDYPSLKRLWVPEPGLSIEADGRMLADIDAYRQASSTAKHHKAIADEMRGRIRIAMQEATAVMHGGERIVSVSKSGALTVKQQHREEQTQ